MLAEDLTSLEVLPAYELAPGKPIVARLIGRRFEQVVDGRFEKPFDPRFGKMMVKTLSHLCGALGASYGYAERWELSLYAVSQGGEARRLLSRICGEAAAKLSLLLGQIATFEGRLYQFESNEKAYEYFEWRMGQAEGAALDSHCQHVLVINGAEPTAAAQLIQDNSAEEKVELLRQNSVEFERLPGWQRHGSGVYLTSGEATGVRMVVDLNLPTPAEYPGFLRRVIV